MTADASLTRAGVNNSSSLQDSQMDSLVWRRKKDVFFLRWIVENRTPREKVEHLLEYQAVLLRLNLFFGLFPLDSLVDLHAMNRYFLWGGYAQPDFVATDIHDANLDIVSDHNRFIFLSA